MHRFHNTKNKPGFNIRYLAIGFFALIPLALSCSVIPSGIVVERSYGNMNFSRIELSSAFSSTINQAPGYSLTVSADDNLFDYIEVYQSGSTLHIGLRPGVSIWSFQTHLHAAISLPAIDGLELSGASRSTVSNFSGVSLSTELSGASDATLVNSSFSNVSLDLSGASNFTGSSTSIADLSVDLSGASRVDVSVSHSISGTASGASSIWYLGSPSVSVSLSGASSVSHK